VQVRPGWKAKGEQERENMASEFVVFVREVHVQTVKIKAEDEKEAKRKVADGDGEKKGRCSVRRTCRRCGGYWQDEVHRRIIKGMRRLRNDGPPDPPRRGDERD
jgi:bisphosphoglycerate-dependent phosphoglycerate mutase